MIVETRTYRLVPGTEAEFARVMAERAVPLLGEYGITVLGHGLSLVADEGFVDGYLVRAFDSVEQREQQEGAFYGSDDWTLGPRAELLACIESYHTVVTGVADQGSQDTEPRSSE